MTNEHVAYLFRSDGTVYDMPGEEFAPLLEAIQRNSGTGQPASPDSAAIHAFLQAFKRAMQAAHPYNEGKSA